MRQRSRNAITYRKAEYMERRQQEQFPDNPVASAQIQIYSEKTEEELEPVSHKVVAGECLPDLYERGDMDVWSPTNTLIHPNSIRQTASLDRLALAEATGYQELCIDAADTIGAENSLEKMLSHQMAVCHVQGMTLVSKASKVENEVVSLKILNTATKFLEVYQKGFEAIHKVKRGNRQTVIVKYQQQVNVGDGGQAMITGDNTRRDDA